MLNDIELKEQVYLVKSATNTTFEQVVTALNGGMINMSSDLDGRFEEFLNIYNPNKLPYILIADNSFGERFFVLKHGLDRKNLPYFENPGFNGGWHLIMEKDLRFLFIASHTSGTKIEVFNNGYWDISLYAPISEGIVYKGFYWKNFHKALEINIEE